MPDITLYHIDGTRSVRIRWLLEEMGLPYRLAVLTHEDRAGASYRAIHPFGRVPALRDGDVALFESGAIAEYLLQRYDDGTLSPPVDTAEGAQHLSWMHAAEGTLLNLVAEYSIQTKWLPPERRSPETAAFAAKRLDPLLTALEQTLTQRPYIAGEAFRAADVMIGHAVYACGHLELLPQEAVALPAYRDRVTARPAFATASAPAGAGH